MVNEVEFMNEWRLRLLAASEQQKEDIEETASLLGISKASYYRRRRGDMSFSAYEFVLLSKRFGLSMDPSKKDSKHFRFLAPLEANRDFDEEQYLRSLEASNQSFIKPEETDILVSTTDIPIFYLFSDPDIAALKRYLFGLAIDAKGARSFDLSSCRKEHSEFIGRIATVARKYRETHRQEVWGPNPLHSLIFQILLLVESSAISQTDCMKVFTAIDRVVDFIEKTLNSKDDSKGSLKLWQNKLHATSSIIQVKNSSFNVLFVTFDNPNFLSTSDPKAIQYFNEHFDVLKKRSLRIAGHGMQSPARYAGELRKSVERGRQKAQSLFTAMQEDF